MSRRILHNQVGEELPTNSSCAFNPLKVLYPTPNPFLNFAVNTRLTRGSLRFRCRIESIYSLTR